MCLRLALVMILVLGCSGQFPLIADEAERPSLFGRVVRVVSFGTRGRDDEEEQQDAPPPVTVPENTDPTPKDSPDGERRSFLSRFFTVLTFGLVGGDRSDRDRVETRDTNDSRRKVMKSLAMEVKTRPEVIKLSETRRIHVHVRLANNGRKMVSLRFPTTQRLEIRLIERGGKVVEQWSESRAFAQILGHVAINSGERVEYHETISVRELVAGSRYDLEVSVPGYPDFTTVLRIVPER